jgi:hypothetical protein
MATNQSQIVSSPEIFKTPITTTTEPMVTFINENGEISLVSMNTLFATKKKKNPLEFISTLNRIKK